MSPGPSSEERKDLQMSRRKNFALKETSAHIGFFSFSAANVRDGEKKFHHRKNFIGGGKEWRRSWRNHCWLGSSVYALVTKLGLGFTFGKSVFVAQLTNSLKVTNYDSASIWSYQVAGIGNKSPLTEPLGMNNGTRQLFCSLTPNFLYLPSISGDLKEENGKTSLKMKEIP